MLAVQQKCIDIDSSSEAFIQPSKATVGSESPPIPNTTTHLRSTSNIQPALQQKLDALRVVQPQIEARMMTAGIGIGNHRLACMMH